MAHVLEGGRVEGSFAFTKGGLFLVGGKERLGKRFTSVAVVVLALHHVALVSDHVHLHRLEARRNVVLLVCVVHYALLVVLVPIKEVWGISWLLHRAP